MRDLYEDEEIERCARCLVPARYLIRGLCAGCREERAQHRDLNKKRAANRRQKETS